MHKPVALIIMDGWGIREMTTGNAVKAAHTPNVDRWLATVERSILDASGEAVGLVAEQMGNSEVGHLNLGAGFIVDQDIRRIDKAIASRELHQHPILTEALGRLKAEGKRLHLVGLFSPGGVHSHSRQLYALLEIAHDHGITPVVHVITDGRDTPPNSAIEFIEALEAKLAQFGGQVATLSGRYYAMDRDKRWQRTQLAYDAMVLRKGDRVASLVDGIQASYDAGVTDEFIVPVVLGDDDSLAIGDGDTVLCFNFRADRMRQIVRTLVLDDFDGFVRERHPRVQVISFTRYEEEVPTDILFPKQNIAYPLARVLSDAGMRQYHAAETEKYPHVTFFFNGGQEDPFPGEERLLVASPKVATYDLQPEMSAPELTERLLARIASHDDDFIIVNFANPDMVGHTGSLAAATKAVETVDACVGQVVSAVNAKGGVALVTADHGNAEVMQDLITGAPHTYHTTNPVGLFVLGKDVYFALRPRGILADVAPTVLHLLGVPQPPAMTGTSVVVDEKAL